MRIFKRVCFLLFIIVFLVGGVYSIYMFYVQSGKENALKKETDKGFNFVREVQSENKSGKEKSMALLEKLREDRGTNIIKGYLSTGEGGIQEPFVHTKDDRFNRKNLFEQYDDVGTVFLYKENNSPMDDVTTYFGHRLDNYNARFTPIGKYNKFKDKVQNLDIFIEEGILKYKLVYVVTVSSNWYDKYNTWSSSGLKEFWRDSSKEGTILDSFGGFKEGQKYAVLSTCSNNAGSFVTVAIYKLLDFEK